MFTKKIAKWCLFTFVLGFIFTIFKNINYFKVVKLSDIPPREFQNVNDDESIFVYSAYYQQSKDVLRLIGVTSKQNNTTIYCWLHYNNNRKPEITRGYIYHMTESHGRNYTATYLIFDVRGQATPDYVSVVESPSEQRPPNILPVITIPNVVNRKRKFVACVSPLHSQYNDTTQLIEWTELNKILGTEHFMVYVNSVSKGVMDILKYYENQGLVSIFNWTLPENVMDNLHYYGQLAAINDCLYLNKLFSEYISTLDLDEYIIPQQDFDLTWDNMLQTLPSEIKTSESVFIFRCSFFSQRKTCAKVSECHQGLTIGSYMLKDNFSFPSPKRSKYFAKTDAVDTLHVHSAEDNITGKYYVVPADIGILHHYRKSPVNNVKKSYAKVKHMVARKYIIQLKTNIKIIRKNIELFDK